MNKILYVVNENFINEEKIFILEKDKYEYAKQNDTFKIVNITSPLDFNPIDYDIVLFNWNSLYLFKFYFKQNRIIAEKNFNKLLVIKNKFFIFENMHNKTYKTMDDLCIILNKNRFNIIFTYDDNDESKYIKKRTGISKHFYLPHHINTNRFKIYKDNEEKNIDILLYGCFNPIHYPFASRIFNLIMKNKDKFKVKYININENKENTEKDEDICNVEANNNYVGENLSKLLNKSKISICTKTRYNYLTAKYFEIASSNCLIAGDLPNKKEIFENNIIELNEKMSDEDIIYNLEFNLNNYQANLDNMEELASKISINYNLDKYFDKLLNILYANVKLNLFNLCIYDDKDKNLSKGFIKIFDLMLLKTNSEVVDIDTLIKNSNNLETYIKYKYCSLPKYVIIYGHYEKVLPILNKLIKFSKVITLVENITCSQKVAKYIIPFINNSYFCISPYAYELSDWELPLISNNYFFPHCAIWLMELNLKPIKKILLSGTILKNQEDRNFLLSLAKSHTDYFDILPYENKKRPEKLCYDKKYYEYLSKYICCIVDSIDNYILPKIFEICASGSLLLCFNNFEIFDVYEKLGFIDGTNYISCNSDNIIEKIEWILNPINKDYVDLIRKTGYELVKKSHTIFSRYNDLIGLLNNHNFKLDKLFMKKKSDNTSQYKLGFDLNIKNNLIKEDINTQDYNDIVNEIIIKVESKKNESMVNSLSIKEEVNLLNNEDVIVGNDFYGLFIYDDFKSYLHIKSIFDNIINNTISRCISFNKLYKHRLEIKTFIFNKFNKLPKYIFCYNNLEKYEFMIETMSSFSKVIFIQDDIIKIEPIMLKRKLVYEKIYACYSTYKYMYENIGMPEILNHFYLPHCSTLICDFNLKPVYKILLVGKKKSSMLFFLKTILANKNIKYDLYEIDDNIENTSEDIEKYYKKLNNYVCCLIESHNLYILPGVFEICGAGSLLLCYNFGLVEQLEKLGFIDGENYIGCTRNTINDKIDWILNETNKEEINKIRENGYELVKKEHTIENRKNMIIDTLKNLDI